MSAAAWFAETEKEFDPDQVTPGVWGFVAVAVLAAGIIYLGFNLVARLRRNAYRHEVREQIASELDGSADSASAGTGDDSGSRN